MRPIYENTVIHVDITNACYLKCTNCTRHVGHHNKPYFMDLDYVRKAESLQDFSWTDRFNGWRSNFTS